MKGSVVFGDYITLIPEGQVDLTLGNVSVSSQFAAAVCRLPRPGGSNTLGKYHEFMDRWGTVIVLLFSKDKHFN